MLVVLLIYILSIVLVITLYLIPSMEISQATVYDMKMKDYLITFIPVLNSVIAIVLLVKIIKK